MDREKMVKDMSTAAAIVKLICGVANNAAWLVTLEGYDHARKCRRYRHGVKHAFNEAIAEFHRYEQGLLSGETNRMFHLADMDDRIRKKYGDISDSEFYDFWASVGGPAYEKTRPHLTSLWNKYRLSLISHGVSDAEHIAWLMVTEAVLELAVRMYERAIMDCSEDMQLPLRLLQQVFGQFSLCKVRDRWRKAMLMMAPETDEIELGSTEERNINHGLQQLTQAWVDPSILYTSTMDTVEDWGEIFRTKGEQKKALREISEGLDETYKNL